MIYRLAVFLPTDRAQPGHAHLIGLAGVLVDTFPVLGKADNAKAAAKGNPIRDPLLPFGDTPLGVYAPTKVISVGDPENAKATGVGARWFPMIGVHGDAALARAGGRTGLGLHAGRPGDRLIPTYGCLRMLERDLEDLCATIGANELQIVVDVAPA